MSRTYPTVHMENGFIVGLLVCFLTGNGTLSKHLLLTNGYIVFEFREI